MRIAVVGDIGQPVYHVGDEAMTHAVVHEMAARGHAPVLLTRDVDDTRAAFAGDVECARTLVFPWPPADRERYLDEIRRVLADDVEALPAHDQVFTVLQVLSGCDALVIAGGGNMSSRYGWLLHERVAFLEIAAAVGIPSFVTGQTIGPALSRPDVETTRRGLALTLGLGAREAATHALASSLTDPARVHAVLDDASFLADVSVGAPPTRREADGEVDGDAVPASSAGAIVVTVSPGSLGVDGARTADLASALDALAAHSGAPVHLVPHMATPGERDGDVAVHDALAAAMRTPAVVLDIEHALVAARRAREAALVVTTRYHPAVFAVEGAVPVLAIAPDDYTTVRIRGALANWGVPGEAVLPLASVSAGLLTRRLLGLWDASDEVASVLRRNAEVLRAAVGRTWDTVSDALVSASAPAQPLVLPEVEPVPVPRASPDDVQSDEAPLVTIVVRTKDRPAFLVRALDDIAAQTLPSFQVVVVNDAGDPGPVEEIVASCVGLAGRAQVLHRAESTGMEAASNAGLALARGRYVAIHDDDDTWDESFLARTTAHLEAHPEADAVAVRTEIVRELPAQGLARPVETGRELFEPGVRVVTVTDLLRFNRMVPISYIVRRSVLDEIGTFDESLSVVGDWEFNLRLAKRAPITVLHDRPLAFWHQRPGATGTQGNSVHAQAQAHRDVDLLVRDERLRRHIAEHGDADLLYLTRFMHERHEEMVAHVRGLEDRLETLEERLDEATTRSERLLGALEEVARSTREAGVVGLARRKYWAARHRAARALRRS